MHFLDLREKNTSGCNPDEHVVPCHQYQNAIMLKRHPGLTSGFEKKCKSLLKEVSNEEEKMTNNKWPNFKSF